MRRNFTRIYPSQYKAINDAVKAAMADPSLVSPILIRESYLPAHSRSRRMLLHKRWVFTIYTALALGKISAKFAEDCFEENSRRAAQKAEFSAKYNRLKHLDAAAEGVYRAAQSLYEPSLK